jgi:outer membrane protein assembly factor BamB
LPTPITGHGVGTSPILAGAYVILLRDQDIGSELLALDRTTGKTAWRTPRPEFRRGFCTPVVLGDGQQARIIAPGTLQAVAYELHSGREVWRMPGLPNEICSSPVVSDGVVILGGWTPGSGFRRMPEFDELLLRGDGDSDGRLTRDEAPAGPARQHFQYIDADRDGLVSRAEYDFIADAFTRSSNGILALEVPTATAAEPRERWRQTRGLPYVPTPLIYGGRVYLAKNGGMVTCIDLESGRTLFQEERLGVLGDNYASPVAADGKIAIASRSGTVAVIKDGETLEVLARNPIGESIMATPAIAHDTLYVRTERSLWAFRETPPKRQ